MARSHDEIVRQHLGDLAWTLVQMTVELEVLREENARLRAEAVKAQVWSPQVSTTLARSVQ